MKTAFAGPFLGVKSNFARSRPGCAEAWCKIARSGGLSALQTGAKSPSQRDYYKSGDRGGVTNENAVRSADSRENHTRAVRVDSMHQRSKEKRARLRLQQHHCPTLQWRHKLHALRFGQPSSNLNVQRQHDLPVVRTLHRLLRPRPDLDVEGGQPRGREAAAKQVQTSDEQSLANEDIDCFLRKG